MKSNFEVTQEVLEKSISGFVMVPLTAIGRRDINPRSTGLSDENLISIVRDLLKSNANSELVSEEAIRDYIRNNAIPSELIDSESETEVPVILGEIDGEDGLVIIDGYHREKASSLTKKTHIKSKVKRFASMEDAREEAFRLNEAKGLSLNPIDVATSLYENFAARLKKGNVIPLENYVKSLSKMNIRKAKGLVYYAFIKRGVLGEDIDETPKNYTIYEDLKSIAFTLGAKYDSVPYEVTTELKQLIEEAEDRNMFNQDFFREIKKQHKTKQDEGENVSFLDLIDSSISIVEEERERRLKGRGLTKEENDLANTTAEELKRKEEAVNEASNGYENGETDACAHVPTKGDNPVPENEVEAETVKEVKEKPIKEATENDSVESSRLIGSYATMILTIGRGVPNTITQEVKNNLIEAKKMIDEILAL
ncbi:MAG: hypothetical protein ACRCVH_13590 [Vagococcus fluvialis]